SIRNATAAYAYNMMTYYANNQTSTPAEKIGNLPAPYYWWEAGAMWGGLVDYWAYTKDSSYVNTTLQALVANFGPNADLMVPAHRGDEGNDDQAFWAIALMSAVEYGFPSPPQSQPQYLNVAKAAFDSMAARWDLTSCNGGLKWQIFPENAYGYNYKNSISNGGLFALAARLARYTGNQTYVDWAEKTWDWCERIGLISSMYEIFDGTDDNQNCTQIDHLQWTYGVGIFLHGAATLYNYTNGSSLWQKRTSGLLDRSAVFFSPYPNATDVMYEAACETVGTCDTDQQSFKAYLGRFLAKTAVLAPYTAASIKTLLTKSAAAAATSCSGGKDGVTCGTKWYTGAWDSTSGVGQQLSALEVTQALLVANAGAPETQANVHLAQPAVTTTISLPARSITAELQTSNA
ncbi:glycoside hydrolase family 76 protein, partial [Glonium stellatum]